MKKFEYRIEKFYIGDDFTFMSDTRKELDKMGKEGWENYAVIQYVNNPACSIFYFKREILR